VANCPICQSEYVEAKVNLCSTCGWDLTPYPLTFAGQIPESFLDKEQANLSWSKEMWKRKFQLEQTLSKLQSRLDGLEAQQQQIKSDIEQIKEVQKDINLEVETHREGINSLYTKNAKARNITRSKR
jgi:TolA-binding protein